MGMNISSMGAVASSVAFDSEYQRIIRELRALGLEPTGDKATDKTRLETAKAQQAAAKNEAVQCQAVTPANETEKDYAVSSSDNIKQDIAFQAQNMTGAEQIAQLNKFKLLGLY